MQSDIKKLTYSEWHLHLENELNEAYKKLKLKRKYENVQAISPRESFDIPRVQEGGIQSN
ncbi:MAG: hypothetical protein RLZ95_972 [Bacteroidota bacterium]|jgi:hypothetical protein